MTREVMVELAKRSIYAERDKVTVSPITEEYSELTVDVAYQIQKVRQDILTTEGIKLIGGKMGLTSLAKMKQMGATESPYGKLFDYMQLGMDVALKLDELIHPRIESEIAFVMEKELYGPYITSVDVLDATAYISPSFEIIDSRYHGFKFKNPDSVADNISAARFKLGAAKVKPLSLSLPTVGVTISINGENIIFAASGAVLGHPARAIAAYVNMLARNDEGLHAGQIVLSGAITAATPIARGDYIRAQFQGMGHVDLHVE